MLFVTNNTVDAQRYGNVFKIDMTSHDILETIEDPHVKTHRGWIVLMKPRIPLSNFSISIDNPSLTPGSYLHAKP